MQTRFRDRTHAGRALATQLTAYANRSDTLILGLPRGGVPVAYEVAQALNLPLDICLVRKLGVPGHKELAMGAIASDGVRVFNYDVLRGLDISDKTMDHVVTQELHELQRRDRVYRGNRPRPQIRDRIVIVVDDGMATGATMKAALRVLRSQQPKKIVVAVPIAPRSVYQELSAEGIQMVCLATPEPFYAIGLWYENFTQTTDKQVRTLLARRPALV